MFFKNIRISSKKISKNSTKFKNKPKISPIFEIKPKVRVLGSWQSINQSGSSLINADKADDSCMSGNSYIESKRRNLKR